MSEEMNVQQDTTDQNAAETPQETRETVREASDDSSQDSAALVPVTEAKKYRKRAQHAEQSLRDMEQQLHERTQRIDELEQTVNELERRERINELLVEADAVDLEAARLLTEVAVRQMDEPDVNAAVTELKRTRPFLFRAAHPRNNGAMSARIDHAQRTASDVERAAIEAVETGHRNDLLRYLRLRRKPKLPHAREATRR